MVDVRPRTENDRAWADEVEAENWSEPVVARLVRNAAIEAGCTRLWLITTNDNLRALELYQRWGMEIVAFHRHAVTEARRHLNPSTPERGAHGIPIAHEFELELRLQPPGTSTSSL